MSPSSPRDLLGVLQRSSSPPLAPPTPHFWVSKNGFSFLNPNRTDRRSMDADRTSSRRTYCSQFSGGRYCSTSAAVGARGIPKHKCKFDRLPGQPLPTQPSSKAEEIVQSVCCECGHAVISTEHCPDCNASKHDICGPKNDENDTETSARRCSVW